MIFAATPHDPIDESLPIGGGHPNHRKHPKDFPAVLDVVTCISNPVRFRSRLDLYRQFERHMLDSGVRLWTIEAAYGGRPFEITNAGNPQHIQVRTNEEIWLKENLLNIAINRLPNSARYIAWIDADITFPRVDWAQETLQLLQHYSFVQLWSHAQDLGPNHEPMGTHLGFVWTYYNMPDLPMPGPGHYVPKPRRKPIPNAWHPGLAWAARREALDAVGGLLQFPILGAADHHMAKGLINRITEAVAPGIHPNYMMLLKLWQDQAEKHVRRNIGYLPCTISHHYHGQKTNRRYWDRWKILVSSHFDPLVDLSTNTNGVLRLVDDGTPRYIKLRDDIRSYFRGRAEDCVYVPQVADL